MLARIFNNLESLICRTLLSGFVLLLFVQIVAREVFGYSFSWIEELSVYMFVWFVFFGASYAALKGAHNRVTFQFRFLPRRHVKWIEAFADLFWVAFNVTFIWLSYDFVFNKMNKFWKSQTLGIEMKWVYVVLPVAFTLMTIRILQVNYIKLVRGDDVSDPDQIDLDAIQAETPATRVQEA
ncbi:MAG: TRAP transporter small permease [Marinovum algicola]|jgi:C4-dicarboxylate transporter DctQ subunit|uniref:TRAP transporter small permease protein n=1 Tax=Marinovum algicola TaxID=42444 RepID=A0A975WCS4_9RHOB|nr:MULTISPECIES: TRAP transporter small permease [Marinovum]AKO99972.1 TRAP-type C4-dicarboxylate transport system, small permease component / Taurine transporter [Marinovum algicola DG 898]MDD9745165.1 TRAP transporter small permease [Marinovum sp. PR37]SEJ95164.1 TRAP-type C4-dicarboxylate transport system, small permease component [Marinovum algicola]SLN68243.1 Sialic acid TRAP transporter permease protein SiaT [Marinovum algicola]